MTIGKIPRSVGKPRSLIFTNIVAPRGAMLVRKAWWEKLRREFGFAIRDFENDARRVSNLNAYLSGAANISH